MVSPLLRHCRYHSRALSHRSGAVWSTFPVADRSWNPETIFLTNAQHLEVVDLDFGLGRILRRIQTDKREVIFNTLKWKVFHGDCLIMTEGAEGCHCDSLQHLQPWWGSLSNYLFTPVESVNTTSVENVTTGVLDKNEKHYLRCKDKAKKKIMWRYTYWLAWVCPIHHFTSSFIVWLVYVSTHHHIQIVIFIFIVFFISSYSFIFDEQKM